MEGQAGRTDLSNLNYNTDYKGHRAYLSNKLGNTIFERVINEEGLPDEIMSKITFIPVINRRKIKLGGFLRRHHYDLFCKLCNEWRRREMNKMGISHEIQEEMFATRWKDSSIN